MLSGGEGAEIIQHTHCCDSSELPDFYTFWNLGIFTFGNFYVLVLLLHCQFLMLTQYTNCCDSSELPDFTHFYIFVFFHLGIFKFWFCSYIVNFLCWVNTPTVVTRLSCQNFAHVKIWVFCYSLILLLHFQFFESCFADSSPIFTFLLWLAWVTVFLQKKEICTDI